MKYVKENEDGSVFEIFYDNIIDYYPPNTILSHPYEGDSTLGIYAVSYGNKPSVNELFKKVIEKTPVKQNNKYHIDYDIVDMDEEEIQREIENKWVEIRRLRTNLLSETDFLIIKYTENKLDIPVELKDYRQSLRDLPINNSDPFKIEWPTKPSI